MKTTAENILQNILPSNVDKFPFTINRVPLGQRFMRLPRERLWCQLWCDLTEVGSLMGEMAKLTVLAEAMNREER